MERRFDQAVADADRAVALNPNYAMGYLFLGQALTADGQPAQGIVSLQKAIRLDPESQDFYASEVGFADLCMGRYQDAVRLIERSAAVYPNGLYLHIELSIAYTELGKDEEARAQADEVMRLSPQFKVPLPEKMPLKDLALAKRDYTDLRKAGLN
jgi:adenylate cyclase